MGINCFLSFDFPFKITFCKLCLKSPSSMSLLTNNQLFYEFLAVSCYKCKGAKSEVGAVMLVVPRLKKYVICGRPILRLVATPLVLLWETSSFLFAPELSAFGIERKGPGLLKK